MAESATVYGRGRDAARWLIVVLLAGIAVLLAGELVFSQTPAATRTGPAGAGGNVFAIAGQVTRDTYGLYLVDMENGTICAYQLLSNGRLRLMAARTFIYDCQLDSYNTEPPPKDVAELVAEARRLRDITTTTRP